MPDKLSKICCPLLYWPKDNDDDDDDDHHLQKLHEVEQKNEQLQQDLQSMEEKMESLRNENAGLRQMSSYITELEGMLEGLNLDLEKAKSEIVNQCSKNSVLQSQLDLSTQDKSVLEEEIRNLKLKVQNEEAKEAEITKLRTTLETLNSDLEKAKSETISLSNKNAILQTQLELSMKERSQLEEELLNLKNATLKETATQTMHSTVDTQDLSEDSEVCSSELCPETHQEDYEFISRCIEENMGFQQGKPVAACIIFKCLLHWHAFDSETTNIFDHIIQGINSALKGSNSSMLPYWLSNVSALLSISPVEASHLGIMFKHRLGETLVDIFRLIRDNVKSEISPLLALCINAPRTRRRPHGVSSKSIWHTPQLPVSLWEGVIKFLDSLLARLRENHVPSYFIHKIITYAFSFINTQLFNSILLRRECCCFSNGEFVKSGLGELEKWTHNATKEFAGNAWYELIFTRQAVGFLVIRPKNTKSLQEIMQNLCPALSVHQIHKICTLYWDDDKSFTQTVSSEVMAQMRVMVHEDNQNENTFLLEDDESIPFSTEDLCKTIPEIDPKDVKLPASLSDFPAVKFLQDAT